MAGLLFTLFCVLFLLLPLLSKGYDSIPTAIFIIIITTVVCMVLLNGVNSKTISASMGTILGVMISGLLAYISGYAVNVTGYNMNEAESLMLIGSNTNLKIKGLLVAGIFISSLGAVMDVAMSIASSVYELNSVNKNMSSKQLFRSGMNIGKDAMGTMANTLILAFTGSSLNLLLLIFSYGIPMMQLFNTDSIAIEIIQSVAGSIGIILTVPLVAFISSIFVKKLKK
ncbi:YibE/F family protein [Clostridiaceae bacterium WCA-383-APC-5B]|uniref:YibE/F family protein n=2 Tax=Inconstantimicrobium porci TaxID=2652291 RepID=A0A7X2MWS1_9CLOT|nr:YibE/F family protein [Inconstantimicrobium porci]